MTERHVLYNSVNVFFYRVFDTFQYSSFNKRIVYVLAEGILEQLFPDNKFSEIFGKIHARVS
jgi:hypothetical protein